MAIDQRLLDILCCPVTKTPVRHLSRAQLGHLNKDVAAGSVVTIKGVAVAAALDDGLITTDGKVIYRIDDGIPVMLPDEGIGTTQLVDFPD